MERGLGDEQILHHQMLKLCQRLARVLQIRVRHRGILALDIHAGDLPVWIAFMISTTVRPRTGSRSWCPEFFQTARADRCVRPVDNPAGTSGSALRRRRPARCSVRAADAGRCGAPDLPGDQRQRDQAARIVGAVHMLADAMPQKMMEARERAYSRATSRKVSAGMPQIGAIFSGVNS